MCVDSGSLLGADQPRLGLVGPDRPGSAGPRSGQSTQYGWSQNRPGLAWVSSLWSSWQLELKPDTAVLSNHKHRNELQSCSAATRGVGQGLRRSGEPCWRRRHRILGPTFRLEHRVYLPLSSLMGNIHNGDGNWRSRCYERRRTVSLFTSVTSPDWLLLALHSSVCVCDGGSS